MMKRKNRRAAGGGSDPSAGEATGEVTDEAADEATGEVTDEVTDEAGDEAARDAADVAVELSETDQPADQRRLADRLTGVGRTVARAAGYGTAIATRRGTLAARSGAGTAGRGAASVAGWLSGQVLAMGPRLRIRDRAALRAQFPGRTDEEIADLLVERAARATAAVGGATGIWAALPVLPAFPAEIAAETLAIAGIEVKLVAELHEAYGAPAPGGGTERARAYVASWAYRRGVYMVPSGLLLVAGSPLAGQLRRRLTARVRRSAFSLAPLFTGVVAGAVINRRETRKLGRDIRADLRKRPTAGSPAIEEAP
jgi:hypothetical protein